MRKGIITAILLLAAGGGLFYARWSSAIRQPLSFSHASHVRDGIECSSCHNLSALDQLPTVSSCKPCHGEDFPNEVAWVRIYRVAPDILFGHNNHSTIPCSLCHAAMTDAKRFVHRSGFTMKFCMDCHDQQRAPNECGTCHKNR